MHKNNIESFIKNNREEFDQALPSLKVWADIDKALEQKNARRFTIWRATRVAAAVVLLMVSGALISNYWQSSRETELASSIETANPEYAEMVQYYTDQVNNKYQQLVSLNAAVNVEEDLQQVDQVMEELKAELKDAPKGSEEQIIASLVMSYQTKVEILERVLERIQTTNRKSLKPEDDEISI